MVSPITPVQPADALRIGAAWRLLSTNDPTLSAAILSEIEHPHHPAVDEALRAVLRYPIARHRLRGDADSAGPLISPDGRLFACVVRGKVVVRRLADGVDTVLDGIWAAPTALAFRPDSAAIAVGVESGRTWLAPITPGVVSLKECPRLEQHMGPVLRVAWSPDGATLWTGGFDFTLRAWDVATNSQISEVALDGALPECIDVGAKIAVLRPFRGGSWRLLRLDTGRVTPLSEATEDATCFALRPDGREMAIATSEGQVWLFRLDNPHLATVRQAGEDEITDLAYSPDGQRLAACCDDRKVRVLGSPGEVDEIAGHGPIRVVAWMVDGKGFVTGDAEGQVRVQYLGQSQPYRVMRASGRAVQWVGASSDGQHFAWRCEDGVLGAIGARPDPEPRRLAVGQHGVTALAWAPAGDRLFACLMDGNVIEATLEPNQLRGRTAVNRDNTVRRALVTPDGRLAVLDPDALVLIEPATGNVLPEPTSSTLALAGPVDGHLLVATTGGLFRAPLAGGEPIRHAAGDPAWEDLSADPMITRRRIEAMAVDPDGLHVTLAVFALHVERWRLDPPEKVASWDAPELLWDLAASPDGALLALGCGDKLVLRSADLQGDPLFVHELGASVMSVRFSHDGGLVFSSCEDGTVAWWSVPDGALVGRIEGHTPRACIAPHPSLPLLAIGDERSVLAVVRYETRQLYERVRAATTLRASEAERGRFLFGLVGG